MLRLPIRLEHLQRPARGKALIARAENVHHGRRQSVCICNIFLVDDTGVEVHCAVALGTIVAVTPKGSNVQPI